MLSEIQNHLAGHPWSPQIQYFDTIDSTNTYAKALAMQGAPEGTVILADHQTGGRGRLGRSFSSPAGMGIYMSVILRPNCLPEELMHLTCATGVAATCAIGRDCKIKWTNDLVLGKRKLGGILTEISMDPASRNVDWAVVGIGINCCQQPEQFPEEIRDIACSLGLERQAVPALAADLIQALYQMRCDLLTKRSDTMALFRQRCITIGQEISLLRGDQVRHGTALHVEDDGSLLVRFSDGHTEAVASGEVSVRGMYGYL